MQGLRHFSNDVVLFDLMSTPPPPSPPHGPSSSSSSSSLSFSIDAAESAETRIQRLISEHPVIIFSRSSCCMCHVMKKLLATIGVHPTVIELDDHEISALPPLPSDSAAAVDSPSYSSTSSSSFSTPQRNLAPAVFIGGTCVGGLESLVGLHLSGHLVPRLVEVGVLELSSGYDNNDIMSS